MAEQAALYPSGCGFESRRVHSEHRDDQPDHEDDEEHSDEQADGAVALHDGLLWVGAVVIDHYDREGNPITFERWAELCAREDVDYRRVAWTLIGEGIEISTVWLGIDHNFFDGPPLIFETMVFVQLDEPRELLGGAITTREGTETYRWPTEAAALAGHDRIVAELSAQLPDAHVRSP